MPNKQLPFLTKKQGIGSLSKRFSALKMQVLGMSYTWTFRFKGAARVLNDGDDDAFVSVIAPTYTSAIKKILKLRIPNVDSEEDLLYSSCQEEYDFGNEPERMKG